MWPHIAPATRPLAQGFPRAREERPRRLEAEGTVTTLHSDRHACTRVTSRSGEQLFARHQFGTVHMHKLEVCTLTLACIEAPYWALHPVPCTTHHAPCTRNRPYAGPRDIRG